MSISRISLLAISLALGACQTTALEKPSADYDYGTPPSYSEDIVQEYMEGSLKDAESARYRYSEPQKAYCNSGALSGGKVAWRGWVVPFKVNAKNSYGGYAGFQPYYARYENGELIDVSAKYHLKWDFVPELGIGCLLAE